MVLNYENGNHDEVAQSDGEFGFCLPFLVCLFICQFILKVSSSYAAFPDISAWAILSEVDWWPVMVILTRVNVGGVNKFAVGLLDGFTILFKIIIPSRSC